MALRDYVKAQCDNDVDPRIVKYNLVGAGWPELQVDREITAVYARKDMHIVRGNKHLLRWLAVVVAVLLCVMVFVYVSFLDGDFHSSGNLGGGDVVPAGGSEPGEDGDDLRNNTSFFAYECFVISDSVDKDACYRDKVVKGLDCELVDDVVERSFCFRALESTLVLVDS